MKTRLFLVAALASAFMLTAAPAKAAKLGDPAAPLEVAEWVKGGPVDLAKGKGKNIHVVEFWATWCGPCRQSIPHLTELQKKYKDKGVIAIGLTDEDADVVKPFVTEQGDKMEYAVARDNAGKTGTAYMTAYGQTGVPTAFIVDKNGAVVWVGHPMDRAFDMTLSKLVDGTFDLASSQKEMQYAKEKGSHLSQYFDLAMSGENNKKADEEAAWIMENGANDAQLLGALALNILYNGELKYRDKDLAMRAAKKANELGKGADPFAMHAYAFALFEAGKVDEAIKLQKEAIVVNKEERLKARLAKALKEFEAAKAAPAK